MSAVTTLRFAVVVSALALSAGCFHNSDEEAPASGEPTPTATATAETERSSGSVAGEIAGPQLGTSDATFSKDGDKLTIELSGGELVFEGTIDANGEFRVTSKEPVSAGTIEVIEGTITGQELDGSITRKGEAPEEIEGSLDRPLSG
jgi:hypothetical protein